MGLTPLHVAALAGREEVVRELITKYKCPVDCVDSDRNTPLHWAVEKGSCRCSENAFVSVWSRYSSSTLVMVTQH